MSQVKEFKENLFTSSGHSTSVSLRALPQDENIKHIYARGKEIGQAEFEVCKIPVLGQSGAGKTSLLRHLRELEFEEAHVPTQAADLHNIEISRVDDQWKDIVEAVDEEERATLVYTAQHATSIPPPQEHLNTPQKQQNTPLSPEGKKKVSSRKISHYLVFATYVFVNLVCDLGRQALNCGFVPLLCVIIYLAYLPDRNIETGVRYGQAGAIGIIVVQTSLDVLTSYQNYAFLLLVAYIVSISILGAGYSCGFRVGIATALCIFHFTAHDSINKVLEHIYIGEFQNFTHLFYYHIGAFPGAFFYLLTCTGSIPAVLQYSLWGLMTALSTYLSMAKYSLQILTLLFGFHYILWLMIGVVKFGRYLVTRFYINYFAKRAIGLLIGSAMAWTLGMELILWQVHDPWKILESFIGLAVIIWSEVIAWYNVVQNKAFNCVKLRQAILNCECGKKGIPIHFHVIDFAGDAVYYIARQVLMPQSAIYIVVFDFVMAQRDMAAQLEDLVYWLNLVSSYVHTKGPVRSVFIVGTHKNSVDRVLRKNIAKQLTEHLRKSKYFDYLVQNKLPSSCLCDTVVFEVENKVSLAEDKEACYVKQEIVDIAMELSFLKEKVPIKWLKFLKVQERYMLSGQSVITLAELREETQNLVQDENDFSQMIQFFHRRGDIIQKNSRDDQEHYVVLDQTVLIDTVIKLATFCNPQKGFVPLTKHTLETAVQVKDIQPEIMVDLLKTYELVIEYKEGDERLLVLPNRLPKYENGSSGRERPLWSGQETDQHFYIDIKNTNRHFAQNVFLCLLVKCHTASGESYFLDDASGPLIYNNMARLHYHHDIEGQQTTLIYRLTMLNPTIFQNVIQVTTRGTPDMAIYGILSMLHRFLQELIQRDFLKMTYIMGPAETENLDCGHKDPQNHIHVYDLVNEKSKEFPTGDISISCPCMTGTPKTVHVPVQTKNYGKNLSEGESSTSSTTNNPSGSTVHHKVPKMSTSVKNLSEGESSSSSGPRHPSSPSGSTVTAICQESRGRTEEPQQSRAQSELDMLEICYERLVRDLDPNDIMASLVSKRVLTLEQGRCLKRLSENKGREEAATELLILIYGCKKVQYPVTALREALEENDITWLAEILKI